ncbi:MAG: glutamate 5-kinase [Candidatus Protochlamydia sp.]|nr:glutamate 5-kinase [Candidatus Protochlamydia sp.]
MKGKKIIVKIGTSTLTQGGQKLSRRFMLGLVQQLAQLQSEGAHVVLVSSGAIACGRELLNYPKADRSLPTKQMFSSIGQVKLMQTWSELFSLFDLHVGQVLLTRDDFSDRKRYLNARDTLRCLLKHHIIPIINENDTIATKEIRVGDNDNLAALAANLIDADLVILLTDQEGLYTADPRIDKSAKLIPIVNRIDESIFALAGGSSTSLGTGGMRTKIEAAQIASQCGTRTVIASSSRPNVLIDLALGQQIGTLFMEEVSARESRKKWLLSEKRKGMIHVDGGAEEKILHHGASLLSSGIIKTSQTYERGTTVQVMSQSGEAIAVGITNYGSQEIQKLLGKQSESIEEILGYSYGPEIIHRTNMTRIKFTEEKGNEN